MLGRGTYGVVFSVSYGSVQANSNLAMKCAPQYDAALVNEINLLEKLKKLDVPNVPTVLDRFDFALDVRLKRRITKIWFSCMISALLSVDLHTFSESSSVLSDHQLLHVAFQGLRTLKGFS